MRSSPARCSSGAARFVTAKTALRGTACARLRDSTESAIRGSVSRSASSSACERGIWNGDGPREELLLENPGLVGADGCAKRVAHGAFEPA